jgi:predicted HTH domain antitoxin
MKTMTLNIPDGADLDEKEITLMLASRLYESGKLSLGQAADVAGLRKKTFAELLGHFDVSIFNYSEKDLENDVNNV